GYDFSLRVLKADFSRGVELLAQNELHPALRAEPFAIVQEEVADSVAGQMKSPGYRAERAQLKGLLPAGDPALREATPEPVSSSALEDIKQFHSATFRPDLTTIVVIGDVEAGEARRVVERWFGHWKASGPKPAVVLPRVPPNEASSTTVPDPTAVQ